jgi:UDP-N-acetylmuramoyl-tripeptide--D-alanyl-D-alanine ligase
MKNQIQELYSHFKASSGVSTDTRKIPENCLFFALKGDNFNGNTFAQEALEKGAKLAIIDEAEFVTNDRCFLVEDVLEALQALANFHRKELNIPIIGLTGSNGKTTTKELIACVLAKKYATYATTGNLNNHIGVPLTLLAINASHEIAVVEMGANHQKEIELLASIAEPTHGLITNVGKAHLEGFGGIAGVRKGKGELFDFLSETKGTVFINARSETLKSMAAERTFSETIYYLENDAIQLTAEAPFVEFLADNQLVTTHLTGGYNFENMVAAITIGQHFGVPQTDALAAIADYNPTNNRSQMMQRGSNTIIMDAYNANPSSMKVSIENFIQLKVENKIVILGDMRELGEESPAEHLALGKLIAAGCFQTVVLFGELMQDALSALPNAYYFTDKFSLHNWLIGKQIANATILIKGSRGVKLETVLPFLGDE